MCFDEAWRVRERGGGADRDGGRGLRAVGAGGDRAVDTGGWSHAVGFDVGGGEADGSASPGASDDGAFEGVGAFEQDGGVADPSVLEEPADDGAPGGDDAVVGEDDFLGLDDLDADPALAGERLERFDVAAACFPEAEVGSLDDGVRAVVLDKVVDELIGGFGEERCCRLEAVDRVGTGVGQRVGTLLVGGQAGRFLPRPEDGDGVRVEDQGGDGSVWPGDGSGPPDECAMAGVHAVEGADRDDGARGGHGAVDSRAWGRCVPTAGRHGGAVGPVVRSLARAAHRRKPSEIGRWLERVDWS